MTDVLLSGRTGLDQLAVNTLRTLSIDAVERANSGHPGLPLGAAPMAHVLWTRHIRFDPSDPGWPDRDRFVLSAGHGSALLYSLLHLAGFDLTLDDLVRFRQWGSRTPGHPEVGRTPGVETTTGPLGQGFANGVGFAIAEAFLAATFNRPGYEVVNHRVYGLVSDGDLMEGVASEAASLAGHLRLGKIVYVYDDNRISIEGRTDITFTEDVGLRFEAYGWHVLRVEDGNDLEAIDRAVREAEEVIDRPSLVMVRTQIGYGSPNKADSPDCHGSPLGAEEVRLTKIALECSPDESFAVPAEVCDVYQKAAARGGRLHSQWLHQVAAWREAHPDLHDLWESALSGRLPEGWDSELPVFSSKEKPVATRVASGRTLNSIAARIPTLVGGSADLAPSNNTLLTSCGPGGCGEFQAETPGGRNLRFGVREHAMGGVLNGMALHGGLFPYGGTFLVFSDYMRPSIRLAALSRIPVVYVFTHDSVGLGEDGPTHQPVEHLAVLRALPGLTVIRPSDASETVFAWKVALERREGPVALILTRQGLPVLDREVLSPAEGLLRGGYTLADASEGRPQVIVIATGSEVSVALEARDLLQADGVGVRVVALPSFELFEEQPETYRNSVLPLEVTARVVVEAGVSWGWRKYAGDRGAVIGIDRFGESAPGKVVLAELGITPENVVAEARSLLAQ